MTTSNRNLKDGQTMARRIAASFGWVGYNEANQLDSDRLPSLSAWKQILSNRA